MSRLRGYITVNDAADALGRERRDFREELVELHRQHKNVLYRFSPAKNAKLWTTVGVLKKHYSDVFGEASMLDMIELRVTIQQFERQLVALKRKVDTK